MKHQDPEFVAKLEKAIKEKYGDIAIQNPRKFWDEEKEEKYLQSLKEELEKKRLKSLEKSKINDNGVLIYGDLINKGVDRSCPVCNEYSISKKDDVYMQKFSCCYTCYVQWVVDREKRWNSGWRPENNE